MIHSTLFVSVVWGLGESRVSCGTPSSRRARRVSQGPSFRCPCATPASCQPHTAAPRRPPSMRRVPVAEVRHSAALRPPATRVHVHGRKPDGRQVAACSVDWRCAPYRPAPCQPRPAAPEACSGDTPPSRLPRSATRLLSGCLLRAHVCVRGRKMVALAACSADWRCAGAITGSGRGAGHIVSSIFGVQTRRLSVDEAEFVSQCARRPEARNITREHQPELTPRETTARRAARGHVATDARRTGSKRASRRRGSGGRT